MPGLGPRLGPGLGLGQGLGRGSVMKLTFIATHCAVSGVRVVHWTGNEAGASAGAEAWVWSGAGVWVWAGAGIWSRARAEAVGQSEIA